MSHHALQRIVHLVRDAGDELTERRQLLRLRQPLAQRRALGLEPRLPRDVARDQDAARAYVRPGCVSGVAVSRNVPSSRGSSTRRCTAGDDALPRIGGLDVGERVGADQFAQRPREMMSARFNPTRAANASLVCTMRELLVHDGDEIDERVEGVFEQPALAQDVVEELDVLDRRPRAAAQLPTYSRNSALPNVGPRLRAARVHRRRVVRRSMTSVPSARRQPRSGATTSAPSAYGRSSRAARQRRNGVSVVDRHRRPRRAARSVGRGGERPAAGSGGRGARFRPGGRREVADLGGQGLQRGRERPRLSERSGRRAAVTPGAAYGYGSPAPGGRAPRTASTIIGSDPLSV